jgi:tRNA pseudouridine55 synthase
MEDKIRIVNKKRGQTPLGCINELKKADQKLVHLPMTYAGRLDPLAEGVLIILIGEECLKKDEYLKLPKEYEVEILFGFATDTYDVLGKVIKYETTSENQAKSKEVFEMVWPSFQKNLARRSEDLSNTTFDEALYKFIGRIKQSYPPYSSRTVKGVPLFKWAREGKLDEIEIPTHDVFIESIEILKSDEITGKDLLEKIQNDIALVGGDFRQKEILINWKEVLKDKKEENYKTITLRISCGSGVYVRGIANDLGTSLGVPALALNIKRTKVGDYKIIKN